MVEFVDKRVDDLSVDDVVLVRILPSTWMIPSNAGWFNRHPNKSELNIDLWPIVEIAQSSGRFHMKCTFVDSCGVVHVDYIYTLRNSVVCVK